MKVLLSILPFLVTFTSAVEGITGNFIDGCVKEDFLIGVYPDHFPDKVSASHSKYWDISYHGTYKILKNVHSNVTYLLYQCGTTPPPESITKQSHIVVPIPLQDIIVTQTTQIPHIELLGKRTNIKAYIGDPQYISSPCLNELINDDAVQIVSSANATDSTNKILSSHPDTIILGSPWSDATSHHAVIVSESQETSNKAIFEWHKFYAAFFNLEKIANDIFEETEKRYDCVSDNAASISADGTKPKVLWAYYSVYSQGWSVGSCENYYCEYARHCSAELLHLPSDFGSVVTAWANYLTLEEFVSHAKDADVWVFPSNDWNDIYERNKESLDAFVSVKNRQVFDYQASGENAWFEQRMAEYDVVLEDFCSLVNKTTFNPIRKRKWFRNVFTEPVGELPFCENVEDPLDTNTTTCTMIKSDTIKSDPVSSSYSTGQSGGVAFMLFLAGTFLLQI